MSMDNKTTLGVSKEAKRKLKVIAEARSKERGTKFKGFMLVELWIDEEYKKLEAKKDA